MSEALAALSMAVGAAVSAIGEAVGQSENPEEAEEALRALFNFSVQSLLGSQVVALAGQTLQDFQPKGHM